MLRAFDCLVWGKGIRDLLLPKGKKVDVAFVVYLIDYQHKLLESSEIKKEEG